LCLDLIIVDNEEAFWKLKFEEETIVQRLEAKLSGRSPEKPKVGTCEAISKQYGMLISKIARTGGSISTGYWNIVSASTRCFVIEFNNSDWPRQHAAISR
jgi:hypothetical protein